MTQSMPDSTKVTWNLRLDMSWPVLVGVAIALNDHATLVKKNNNWGWLTVLNI